MKSSLEQILDKHSHAKPENLIPILQEIQDEVGFLSEEAIKSLGKLLNIPTSRIYGLATFYNQFRFKSLGKYHIQVCHGSSCHMFGAESLIEIIETKLKVKPRHTSRDRMYSLEVIPCMGACAQSPVISVNGKFYSSLTSDGLKNLLDTLTNDE